MTVLYLDQGTDRERRLEIDSFYEAPMKNHLNSVRKITVEDGAGYPNLDAFREAADFETIHVISDAGEIPLTGNYNLIEDISVNYSDAEKTYFVNLSLGEKMTSGGIENGG